MSQEPTLKSSLCISLLQGQLLSYSEGQALPDVPAVFRAAVRAALPVHCTAAIPQWQLRIV